jgi:hypothetical protein
VYMHLYVPMYIPQYLIALRYLPSIVYREI